MKQNIFFRVIVAIAMMLIGWLPSLAHDFEVDGVFYKKTSDNAVAVTYKGDSYDSYSNEYAGVVVIPSSVNYNGINYDVTSIGWGAFGYCTSLTSIEIPNSVTSIGNSAIYGCTSLTGIEIPNSVTSIGEYAFYGCSSLTSIEITNSVTSIGYHAFSDCESLTSVVWNVKKCSDFSSSSRPFENSPNITSFTFGDEVEHIPAYLCYNLSSLTSIVWNAKKCSDFSSSSRPFENSPNITSFTIGDEVEHIPAYLCYNLSSLTSIQIPNSVTSIGDMAFAYCEGLTSVVWNVKKCSDFSSSSFYNSPNITSFTLGDEVEHIPAYLCYNLSSLTSIQIPNSVTSIGGSAFEGCKSLTSIQIPNSITSIGDYAFEGCESLTSIEIPNSVTSIGDYAFYGCENLTSVVWNVKKCSDFSSSSRPFENSPNITSFTFGDEVEHIPAYLCYRMENLTNIEIPNSVISIGESAFSNGERLIIAVLGNSLTSIEKDAFKGCDNIKKIESKATKAPTIENEDQFSENVYANADLFVPIGYEDNYKYAYAWSEFHNIKGKDFSVKATTISLDKNEVSLKPTQTVVLTETIQPYDTSNKKVTWSSSDDNIAKVDTNGLVIAIAVGEAIITVTTTDGSNLSTTCKVTVVPTLATSIELDKTEISLEATQTATLVATVLPELTTNKSVTWSSSNESIATVDEYGVVTAIAVGEATITATTNDGTNLSASCKVIVNPTLATSITLDKTEVELEATQTATLVATVLPELTTNKSVTWSSSNESIATVNNNGEVTAIAVGEAVITVTTADGTDLSATCKVTVVPTLAVSIEVTPNSVEAEENSEVQLSVNILPENATYKSVEWSSSNDAIASVNANGLVKIRKEGNVVITATTTDGTNLSATCSINVYSGIDGVNGDNVIVATIGDNIVVKNAKLGSVVNVYASNGALVASEEATDGSVVVEAPAKGVYVVAVDGKSFKVMVK